ncbi:MAG TPA: hypothetical protein VEZ40_18480 [Pyrinomonadaceae bacterium]|nr:hypothetical protein [Pyrinomonadaceae bacterium]
MIVAYLAIPAVAQQGGPPPRIENPSPFADLINRRQRETALRGAEIMPGKKATDRRASERLITQVQEDYKQLQIIRNEMVRALKSNEPLDYKRVAERTTEINKRAGRLKDALAFHSPEQELKRAPAPAELDSGQLKEALVNLCNGIITFVESPMFKSPGVVDVQETNKAGRLLYNIIDLSNGIKKNAGKLSKH